MYQHASARKLKIYSHNEIRISKGLERTRREFWNSKAEEICKDKALKTWPKSAMHRVIDTAWVLKETAFLTMEANRIENEKTAAKTKQKGATLTQNIERTLGKHRELLHLNAKLSSLKDPKNTSRDKKAQVDSLEERAREAMGELKRAQETTRKAIENQEKPDSWQAYAVSKEDLADTAEPTADDIEAAGRP